MGIFSFFRQKEKDKSLRQKEPISDFDAYAKERIRDMVEHDYLGKAARVRHEAKQAVKDKDYDAAWRLFHEEKQLYLKLAEQDHRTQEQIIALDGCVSEELANILRLEGKHDQAIVHILYWIVSRPADGVIKRQEQKLKAYFNRCKFDGVDVEDAQRYIETARSMPDVRNIQSQVSEWRYNR